SASFNRYCLTNGIGRHAAQALFPAVLQDQGDGVRQARPAFLDGPTLAVGSWNFRTVTDVPLAIAFDNGGEFISHSCLRGMRAARFRFFAPAILSGPEVCSLALSSNCNTAREPFRPVSRNKRPSITPRRTWERSRSPPRAR